MRFVIFGAGNHRIDYPFMILSGFGALGNGLIECGCEGIFAGVDRFVSDPGEFLDYNPDFVVVDMADDLVATQCIVNVLSGRAFIFVELDGTDAILDTIGFDQRARFVDCVTDADMVIANSRRAAKKLSLWTDTPLTFDGMCCIDVAQCRPRRDLARELVYHGPFSTLRWNRDVMTSIKIADNLGYRSLVMVGDDQFDRVTELMNALRLNVLIEHWVDQTTFINEWLPRCKFGMQLCTATTAGRIAAECAAIGIPCIGTPNYYQEQLFPALTVDWPDPEAAERLIKEQIENKDRCAEIMKYSTENVQRFTPVEGARKILGYVRKRNKLG